MKKSMKKQILWVMLCLVVMTSCFCLAYAAEWSDWTEDTSKIGDSRYEYQSKTQISTRKKETTTNTSSYLSGWTRDDSKTTYSVVWSGSVNYYDSQRSTSDTYRYVGTRTVSAGTQTRLYRYYCRTSNGGYDFLTWPAPGYQLDEFWVSSGSVYSYDIYHTGQALYWSDEIQAGKYPCWKGETREVYKTQYGYESGTKVPLYFFYRWSAWSAWTDGSGTNSDTTRTRTVYRYRLKDSPAATHTVTYNYSLNGGQSTSKTTATVSENAAIDLTPTASKSGWTFVGWNTNSNAITALSSLKMGSSNIVLYAIYKKSLTGTFVDYNGSTKTTRTVSTTIYNNATSGTISAPTQNTYTGWSKCGWTNGTSADASATSSFSITNNTTYYGIYQRSLTLSYNSNGGSYTPTSQTGTQYVNSYNISTRKNPVLKLANAINKAGATFDGWALGSISGTKYSAGTNLSLSASTTMFATWKSNSSNIYNLGEETYSFVNYRDKHSDGHCFGMSSTSSMYYLKMIDITRVGGQGTNVYALPFSETVRKPICHYQDLQEYALDSMVAGGTYYRSYARQYNITSDWNEVVNYVKGHEFDEQGILQIGFRSDGLGGHAINFLRYAVENGQARVYAYDNNFPTVETYFYQDSSGQIKQAPKATFGGGKIDCICLRDMTKFRRYAGDFNTAVDNSSRKIVADRDSISIENINAYPIDGDVAMHERVLYLIPEGITEVKIVPNKDYATFTYCNEEYHFGRIDDETYGIFVLKTTDEEASSNSSNFTIENEPDVCPWCGGEHTGFFGGIVGFFHRIFAAIFGARY